MVDTQIIRVMMRRAPNYHTFDRAFCRDHFSICPCPECVHSQKVEQGITKSPAIICGRVAEDFAALGCPGYAIVSRFATCDAARRQPEDYSGFHLEAEAAKMPPASAPTIQPAELFDQTDGRATGADFALPDGGANA